MKVFILGANGFIGSHLSDAILAKTDWTLSAIDLQTDKIENCLEQSRFKFFQGDITQHKDWVKAEIAASDVVLPLVAIATPATYVQNPLRIFELDFEANLEIIRHCAQLKTRIIFPSTSEVYGMCPDTAFDEETSNLVTGPIQKERWIYSSSKQLLDRLIYAYGKQHDLDYTLFRPFNWYGPRLDNVFNPKPGGSRVLTQFIGNILRGEDIQLVNGGAQRRCFTYIDDGIEALLKIIENPAKVAYQRVFNIGNPYEDVSIQDLASLLIQAVGKFPAYAEKAAKTRLNITTGEHYFGAGYQDVNLRVPAIRQAEQHLGWKPRVDLKTGLDKTLEFYLK
jgi:nucleoside-diphosphate-sugar epimerase